MAKTSAEIINIVRNVTGRVDSSDPQFTDSIMLNYVNDFYQLEMSSEMRLNERMTWWVFNILPSADPNAPFALYPPIPVNLQNPYNNASGIQFSTIGPLVYIGYPYDTVNPALGGTGFGGFQCFWYQDPQQFYWRFPDTQFYQPQRPTNVLYYNNELIFRQPPDQIYTVTINAYQFEPSMTIGGSADVINQDYLWRYIAYGAARDIFSDYGELDLWERYERQFRRYKALVYSRTYQQNMNQRSMPRF